MIEYIEMKKRHQQELNALPLHFAFGNEQMEKKMAELGLTEKNLKDKVVSIGYGGFMLKEDAPKYIETVRRHARERKEAIESDKDGTGYIYQMFRYELQNYEYGYTGDDTDTIEHLGFTREEIENSPALRKGLKKAKKSIREVEWC